MAIYLHDKYADKIGRKFKLDSLIKGRFSDEYSFSGAKTVKIMTPQTVKLGDYQRSGVSRYGTPTEMQDTVQELTLTQDKCFTMTIDKGNNQDQHGLKAAGKMLALEIEQECIPMLDKYAFETIAHKAGTIVANATALSKTNIVDRITDGTVSLDNADVPQDNRTLFVSAEAYKMLRLSDEFVKVEALAQKSLAKGQVGELDGMAVVKVPASRWPQNLNFMIVHKSAATVVEKINDTKLHVDPPGISGNLLEGRMYFDAFVFAPTCRGVYVEIDTASGKATQAAAPTITATTGALSCATSGATIYYTTDGSDPRYSMTAKAGTASDVTSAGTVVQAYADKDGMWASGVTTAVLTE